MFSDRYGVLLDDLQLNFELCVFWCDIQRNSSFNPLRPAAIKGNSLDIYGSVHGRSVGAKFCGVYLHPISNDSKGTGNE